MKIKQHHPLRMIPRRYVFALVPLQAVMVAVFLLLSPQPSSAQDIQPRAAQLQNKATGLLLRPYEADNKDGTAIVVYPQYTWKCMTWDLVGDKAPDQFRFRNYFTNKTFQPDGPVKEGTALVEATIQKDAPAQAWRMVKAEGEYYSIRPVGSDLVLTVEGEGTNARVILKKWTGSPAQLWKLLPKPAKFTA